MGEVNVCRICLMDDVNMHNLYSYPLESCYKLLVGENTLTSYLPITVCYLCAAQLRKLYSFKGKCLRAQAALTRVLHSCGGITSDFLKQIDRQNLQLTNKLIIQKVPNISIVSEVFDIKEEPLEVADSNYFDEKESVKLEDGFDDLAPLSTDDDEPLSVHKEKKEGSGRKKRRNRRTEETQPNNTEEQFKYDIEVEIAEPSAIVRDVPEAAVRRKRGRPRKNDAGVKNMEKTRRTRNTGGVLTDDIALENYCTVIKLSEEDQKEEVNKRQQSSNYLNALYQCTLCYKGFIDADAWKHHIGKHDPSAGDIECPICKFRFKTKRTLQKHSANHEKKYACKSCPYVSKTTTQAKQHQRWHKGVTYKCQYCEEILTKWTSYLSHVRMKHPSEFICGVCGYSFVSKLGLNMHKTMMHKDVVEKGEVEGGKGKEDTPYCERCDVRFVSVEAFKRHMVTSVKHTQSTDFNNGCRMCGESFPDAEALRVHHRRAHARKRPHNYGKKPSALTWPTNCVHCSEEMANARVYWAHFRRAHPDKNYPIQKNYVCDICGKSFRGNAFLVYHKRTHFEERAYKCQQCPKAFFNRTNLQMHEKTHSEHRPHACSVCAKAFKCKGALDRHFRCHTGVKPYECEVCGKAFAQSNSRKLHVATVHLKQPSPYISRSRQERRNKTQPHKDLHGAPQFLYQ